MYAVFTPSCVHLKGYVEAARAHHKPLSTWSGTLVFQASKSHGYNHYMHAQFCAYVKAEHGNLVSFHPSTFMWSQYMEIKRYLGDNANQETPSSLLVPAMNTSEASLSLSQSVW